MKNSKPLSPISTTFQRSWYFFEHHFLNILFAIALPVIVGLALLWTAFGVTLAEIQQTGSIDQLLAIFSLSSPTAYMLLVVAVAGFIIQIIGLIAGPLVMVEPNISWKEIFPKSFSYFFSYLRLTFIVMGAVIMLYLICYLLITIITIIAGMINIDFIAPTLDVLSAIVPNLALVMAAVFFIFAPFVLVQIKTGAYQALVMSAVLVKNNFWGIVVRLVVVLMCVFVIGVALSFIPYVGFALSALVSSIVMTIYTFVLYEDVTKA